MEVVKDFNPALVKELLELEQQAFPPEMQFAEGESYYSDCLRDRANINIVMCNHEGKVIGYVVAVPLSNVYESLKQYDPDIGNESERLYVDTIQTLPGERQAFGFIQLLNAMFDEALRLGTNKFSLHARQKNGLSKLVLRLFPTAKRLRTIENWYGWGEPFDYIEGKYIGRKKIYGKVLLP